MTSVRYHQILPARARARAWLWARVVVHVWRHRWDGR